jgi:hypothetical protein
VRMRRCISGKSRASVQNPEMDRPLRVLRRTSWGVFLPASTFHWLYDRKTLPLPPMTKQQTARVESTSFTVEVSFYPSVLINALVLLPSSLGRDWRVRLRDHRR